MASGATKIHFSVKKMGCDYYSGASVVSAYYYCALKCASFFRCYCILKYISMLLFSCVFQWSRLPSLSYQCIGMCCALVCKKVIFNKPVLTGCFLVWGKNLQHNLSVLLRDQLFLSVMQAELCKSSIFFGKCNSPSSFHCSSTVPENNKIQL